MADDEIVLNVARLRVLRELAQRGSIAAVADALWLTPSAVSQQLAALERETRVELVERAGRGVRLTEAGRLLAEHSDRVFAALDEARSALRALRGAPSGRLRVASFPSVVRVVLPRVIASLRARFPELVLEVEDLEGEQSLDAVRLGHADIAVIDDLTWNAVPKTGGMGVTELFATPLVVAFSETHAWAQREAVGWADLAGQPQVTEQRSSLFARSVHDECRRAGVQPEVRARVHDGAALLALVAGGELVAVLPELQVLGQAQAVHWRVLEPVVARRLLAVTRAGQDGSPAVQALLSELSELTVESIAAGANLR